MTSDGFCHRLLDAYTAASSLEEENSLRALILQNMDALKSAQEGLEWAQCLSQHTAAEKKEQIAQTSRNFCSFSFQPPAPTVYARPPLTSLWQALIFQANRRSFYTETDRSEIARQALFFLFHQARWDLNEDIRQLLKDLTNERHFSLDTALALALQEKDRQLHPVLLALGANPHAESLVPGLTCLQYAAHTHLLRNATIPFWLNAGGDFTQTDRLGRTLLHLVLEAPGQPLTNGESISHLSPWMSAFAWLQRDHSGWTALDLFHVLQQTMGGMFEQSNLASLMRRAQAALASQTLEILLPAADPPAARERV